MHIIMTKDLLIFCSLFLMPLLACLVPARRAARTDPVEALHGD